MTKITKKMMYENLRAFFEENGVDIAEGITAEDVIAFCDKEVEALNLHAEKTRVYRAAKKADKTDELRDAIYEALTEDWSTIPEIAEKVIEIDPEVSSSKITSRLTQLINGGKVERSEQTIAATETSKARRVKAYRRIG